MTTKFDTTRLAALEAELKLTEGPFDAWRHLPIEDKLKDTPSDGNPVARKPRADSKSKPATDKGSDVEGGEDNGEEEPGSDMEDEMKDDEEEVYGEDDSSGSTPRKRELDPDERKDLVLQQILRNVYTLARESEGSCDFQEFLPDIEKLVDKIAMTWCGNHSTALDKSLAHSAKFPLIEHQPLDEGLGNGIWEAIQSFQEFWGRLHGEGIGRSLDGPNAPERTSPWTESFRPHPLSSKLARFKDSVETTPTASEPNADVVYTARCEIVDKITSAGHLKLSPNAEILFRGFGAGWRNQYSQLRYHLLDWADHEATPLDIPTPRNVKYGKSGRSDYTEEIAIEETRKLFFTGEHDCINSFQWAPSGGDGAEPYKSARFVNTFESKKWSGPLATISSGEGKLIRAGKGSAGVWNLDTSSTHGKHVSGSSADSIITFENPEFIPMSWHPHPSQPGIMLTGADYEKSKSFAFASIDLEGGGKFVIRHLGHGGGVTQISTVPGQPQTFVTSCLDAQVRLWDTRMVLPVLTLQASRGEGCMTAAYANPDGIPTIFTEASYEESIRLWDVRARTVVYELSTGNNAVDSLAWDHKRNHLWASTAAESKLHGYRQAIIPPGQGTDWDDERRWPTRAQHWENYFGVMFDAGSSRLYRYMFKELPDTSILPVTDTYF